MQELEKILEELKTVFEQNIVKELNGNGTVDKYSLNPWCTWIDMENVIRKHMNDGWISVEKRMPTQEECKDNLFWITYDGFSSSSRVAKCQWRFSYDENGNDDSFSEFYIDQSPCIYTPSQNLVKAWKIIDIPDPYHPVKRN